jgi:hypothetical protein
MCACVFVHLIFVVVGLEAAQVRALLELPRQVPPPAGDGAHDDQTEANQDYPTLHFRTSPYLRLPSLRRR